MNKDEEGLLDINSALNARVCVNERLQGMIDAMYAMSHGHANLANAQMSDEVVNLLAQALERARYGEISSISLVAVHADQRVSHSSAGDTEGGKTALFGGLVNQLFALNAKGS